MCNQEENKSGEILLILFGFFLLGITIGHLSGISEAKVTLPIIGGLLAFTGGSTIAFLKKLTSAERMISALATISLCTGLLLGVYSGFWVVDAFKEKTSPSIAGHRLLRSSDSTLIDEFVRKFDPNWNEIELKSKIEELVKDVRSDSN